MNYEENKKLINNIIENEFKHISKYKEYEDFKADSDINVANENMNKLLKKIIELLPENFELITDLEGEIIDYCTAACKYYFKEGIAAGTSNLNFLKDITNGMNFYY